MALKVAKYLTDKLQELDPPFKARIPVVDWDDSTDIEEDEEENMDQNCHELELLCENKVVSPFHSLSMRSLTSTVLMCSISFSTFIHTCASQSCFNNIQGIFQTQPLYCPVELASEHVQHVFIPFIFNFHLKFRFILRS